MPRGIKPQTLELEISDPEAGAKYKHWQRCFNSYLAAQEEPGEIDKLEFLVALVNHTIYAWIEEAATYKDVILIRHVASVTQ